MARKTKDKERVALYLTETPAEPYLVVERNGNLNSDIRNRAIELLALLQMDAQPQRRGELAQRLTQYLKDNRYGNTQETAFIVTALGEYLGGFVANRENVSARIEPSVGTVGDLSGDGVYQNKIEGAGASFTITNTGKTDLFVNVVTHGVPEHVSHDPVDNGLKISRVFYSGKGEPIEPVLFMQGESYVVAFTIECSQDVKNIIAVDRLPAGFEVENPRLDPNAVSNSRFEGAVTPSFLDIRDDSVVAAFNELPKGTHHFYYAVRAVTPGDYQLPPAQAQCMYDASMNGRSKGTTIEVQ